MFEKQIKKRAESEDEAQALITLIKELEASYGRESTEGIKKLFESRVKSMKAEFSENMNILKGLIRN